MSVRNKEHCLSVAMMENMFTKDIPLLDMHEWHYMFVYGSLKSGHDNNDYLAGCECVSRGAYTSLYSYQMKEIVHSQSGLRIPYITHTGDTERRGYIRGEVWKVNTDYITSIDGLESNGSAYFRVRLPIIISSHTKQSIPIWTYLGNEKFIKDYYLKNKYFGIHDTKPIRSKDLSFYVFNRSTY